MIINKTILEEKTIDYILLNNMFNNGNHIVVGFSGGADSVCLLHLLNNLKELYEISVTACHINHNLRGEESIRDREFAREFCNRHNINIVVKDINVMDERLKGESIELTARRLRYKIFEDIAVSFDRDNIKTQIATAHNLNDQAETILFRLARGTGLKGLEGIPTIRGRIIRPLLSSSREDIEEYCRFYGLDFITDSSNLSDEYARNQIRHHIIPVMTDVNNRFLDNISKFSVNILRDSSFLEDFALKEEKRIQSKNGLDRKEFLKLDSAISNRIIVNLLKDLDAEVSLKKINDVLKIINAPNGTIEVCSGKFIHADEKYIHVKKAYNHTNPIETAFTLGALDILGEKKVNILLCDYEEYKNIIKLSPDILKKALDYDKIKDIAVLRNKRDGDRIKLIGHSITRPLKKMFNEAKIPIEERPYQLIISDSVGPVWVEGFGSSSEVAPSEHSNRIALVLIGNENDSILQFIEGKD